MSAKSNIKTKRPRAIPTLEVKLKIRMLPATVRTNVVASQEYKAVAKLLVPDATTCLKTRDNALLKTEKLLLIWIF
jgi:hypothetical protein